MSNVIYQTGTINSLLEAVYSGDKTVGDLLLHGDFGLGTYDRVDGEMIVCDGVCYHASGDGTLDIAADQLKTPFAVVSKFHPHKTLAVKDLSFTELEEHLLPYFVSPNIAYAIKVKARFRQISLRSEECQTQQRIRLSELLPKLQQKFTHTNVSGILVGVWYPHYMGNINVPGFHFHFIDDARTLGGHVFAFDLIDGVAEIQEIHTLNIDLINTKDFHTADLDHQDSDAIASVEKMR
jgi:acetolactate decarboxylase